MENQLYLVDPDRIEERNLLRQNFYRQDIGRFKAQVLAERLAQQFGRRIEYLTSPIEQMSITDRGVLTIGCVDNPGAREKLQWDGYQMNGQFSYCGIGGWYIDAGNAEYSGQVLIGNALIKELHYALRGETWNLLPLPTVQQPSLLVAAPVKQANCAEAVAAEEQSPVINQAMANLVLTFVHKLLKGELAWMGAYLDLESGSLTTVPATPENVSRMTGLSEYYLGVPKRKSRKVKEKAAAA
jgi:PRTRC genetic system ThiF family protein